MARTPARLPNGTRISDYVTLGVLTTTVPAGLIDAVLADTGRQSRRQRQLPARLVVYYVMALALYAQASYGEVLRCLLEGVRWLRLKGADPALADKSAITKARIRLGAAPLMAAVRPRGRARWPSRTRRGPGTGAAGWSAWTAPPSTCPTRRNWKSASAAQPASRGSSSFPQLRLLTLAETGTHAIFAAASRPLSDQRGPAGAASCCSSCSLACCAWPTAPLSASSCGARPPPPVPTCSGGCARTRCCPAASG